jgi:hypothetical protein
MSLDSYGHMGPIQVLSDELVLVDWGPMTMTISAWDKGASRPVIGVRAACKALDCLKTLSDFKTFMGVRPYAGPKRGRLPSVVRRATQTCAAISKHLTPMATVAGAIADETANMARAMGADRVIVNNGGDIAIRLERGTRAKVGIRRPGEDRIFATMDLRSTDSIGGIASSGWAGRSLSHGVADIVTVWAKNASLADAAATYIASMTRIPARFNGSVPANRIDHESDLGERLVTQNLSRLESGLAREALARGALIADQLLERRLILGHLIDVRGHSIANNTGNGPLPIAGTRSRSGVHDLICSYGSIRPRKHNRRTSYRLCAHLSFL